MKPAPPLSERRTPAAADGHRRWRGRAHRSRSVESDLRSLAASLWLTASLLVIAPARAGDGAPAVPDDAVRVERAGPGFSVDLVMHAPVAPSLAWAVLTDFAHMADFVPNLTRSEILESRDNLIKVGQKGTARYGFFSTDFESVRDIRLTPPNEIRAHGIGGNIKRLESVMQLEAEPGGTRLHYHAEVVPGFWFPPMIGPALVRHETAEQFSAIIREMMWRQARSTP